MKGPYPVLDADDPFGGTTNCGLCGCRWRLPEGDQPKDEWCAEKDPDGGCQCHRAAYIDGWLNALDRIDDPPCTHLAVSGARWFKDKRAEQDEALAFVKRLLDAPIPRIALENPISVISSRIRKPDQIIQPWMFGHGEVKATCLWLKNLPLLAPTNIVEGRTARVHRAPPSPTRWKDRSRTLQGIADAMAEQWGIPLTLGLEGAA